MSAWIWVSLTLMAALLQAIRTAGQKHLAAQLSPTAVTLVRFLFGLPFGLVYLAILIEAYDVRLPPLNSTFILFTLAASVAQIAATVLLIYLFTLRNFAVGTSYTKTEAFLTAVVGALLFGELIGLLGWIAITISVLGVVIINMARTGLGGATLLARLIDRSAIVGLASGLCFAVTSLFIRNASLSFGDSNFLFTAALTLATMLVMQTTILGVYVALKEPGQYRTMVRNWRVSLFIGATAVLGSIGWFTAMTIERASYVRAVGQVEVIFALMISILFFRETSSRKELTGMALVVIGIVLLLTVG